MKANKAVKRIAHAENLISDVLERSSDLAPDIREKLQDAKAAVSRAKDAVSAQATSEKSGVRKKAATKKAAVKVSSAKAGKKHGPKKQDLEE
jgi:hypothetical protein